MILPRPLQRGGTIGICAPAGPVKPERLARAVREIEASGFRVVLSEQVLGNIGLFSAPDETRGAELLQMFQRADVDAVFCARGGVGSSRLLELLDWQRIAEVRKPLVGLSDTTVLQWVLWQRTGLVSFAGPLAVEWDGALSAATRDHCTNLLAGRQCDNLLSAFPGRGRVLRRGRQDRVTAPLLPGNLTMITTLLGTPYLPDLRDVALLVEDIHEPPHRVDRMFFHLRNAGVLNSLAALLIGDFGDGSVSVDADSIERSALAAAAGTDYPILTDIPFGHGPDRMSLPIGGNVQISCQELRMQWIDTLDGEPST
ncbi:LD-carboxypeptidase [candidate division KSB1 bacterium]|nr:LD-carboxypeptidase [candidate division KSB1 bacterium]